MSDKLRDAVIKRKAELELLGNNLKDYKKIIRNAESNKDDLIEARRIITEVVKMTQEQIRGYIESLVTLAIQIVFPESDYKFLVNFDMKANRTEVNLLVQQGNKEPYFPEEEQAGSILDIISFALRVVMWSLENPRSRNVMIFDEPFKFSGSLVKISGEMMKDISKKLGIQIILTTHSEDLMEMGDRSWVVTRIKGGESVVKQIGIEEKKMILKRRNK